MAKFDQTGYQKLTADGVVSTSGKPVILFGIDLQSGAGGAGSVVLYDGTSTSGTQVSQRTGVTDDNVYFPYPGVVFPSGLYLDVDSNVAYVSVYYIKV